MSEEITDIPFESSAPIATDSKQNIDDIPFADSTLKDNYDAASRVDPNTAAKVLPLATKLNLNPSYVANNLKAIEVSKNKPSQDFFDDVQMNLPKTAAFLSDRGNMAKSSDDLGNLAATEHAAQSFKYASTWGQHIQAAVEGSAFGRIYERGAPPEFALDASKSTYGKSLLAAAIGMGMDYPIMLPAGVAAGAVGGPLAAGPAAFALPALIKSTMNEYYRTGDKDGFANALEKSWNVTKETGKQAIVGELAELGGLGANKALLGKFMPSAAELSSMSFRQVVAKMSAFNLGMTTAGSAVEGKMPTFRDFSTNMILAGGLEGIHMAGANIFHQANADGATHFGSVMDELARGSELRKRDPDAYAAHLNDMGVPPIQIPIEAFKKGFPNAQQFAEHLGLAATFEEAEMTGGNVKIPLGDFMRAEMDKHRAQFLGDLKFDADAKTSNQIKDELDAAMAKTKAQAEAAKTEQSQGLVQGFVSQVKKYLGIPEEPKPTPKAEAPAEKPAPAPAAPLSDNPEVATREQASRDETKAAWTVLGNGPMEIPGLDQPTAERLAELEAAAHKSAEKILLKPQMEEMTRANKVERADIAASYRAELSDDPLYSSEAWLKKRIPGAAFTKYIDGKLTAEERTYFDSVAEAHGFSSGAELAAKLQAAPSLEDAVSKFVEDTAPKEFRNTPEFRAEALKAIHNEKSEELLSLKAAIFEGMKAGEKQEGEHKAAVEERAKAMRAFAKEYARLKIASLPVEDAGAFRTYYTQETEAALRAYKANQAGDYEGAAKALREQLQAHALASEAIRASKRIEPLTASLEKMQSLDRESFKNEKNFNQVAALLDRFGFPREDYDPSKKTESLPEWSGRMDNGSGNVAIAPWLMGNDKDANYKSLRLDQLQDVSDAAKNIRHIGNVADKMESTQEEASVEDVVRDLLASKRENTQGGKTRRAGDPESKFDWLVANKDALRNGIIEAESLLSKMDGFADSNEGKFQKTLLETKHLARTDELRRIQEFAPKWKELHSVYSDKERRENDTQPVWVDELGKSKTKSQILTIACYQGVLDARQKVAADLGIPQSTIDTMLDRLLDKRDRDFVQAKIDLISSFRPDLAKLYIKNTGFEPTWVSPEPIRTKHGEYPGGYYPLVPDPLVSGGDPITGLEDDQAITQGYPAWKAATQNGSVEERNIYARYPVSLSADAALRRVNDVIHDLSFHDWVVDANKILGHKDISAALIDSLGKEGQQVINRWVKETAGNNVKPTRDLIEKMSADLRGRTTVAYLGSNVAVALSQLHGVTLAGKIKSGFGMTDVGAGMVDAFKKLAFKPSEFMAMVDFAHENSPFMLSHSENVDSSVMATNRELMGRDGVVKTTTKSIAGGFFQAIHYLTSVPIWNQAYKAGIERNGFDHDEAVQYADSIIRDSTVSGDEADKPMIMKNSETGKLVTQFCGFFNKQVQALYKTQGRMRNAISEGGAAGGLAETPNFIGSVAAISIFPGFVYALTHYGLPSDKHSKQEWEKFLIKAFSPISPIPVANTIQDMVVDRMVGLHSQHSLAPASALIEDIQKSIGMIGSKNVKKEAQFESVARIGALAGPYPQKANDIIFNAYDIAHGMKFRFSDLVKRRPMAERHR